MNYSYLDEQLPNLIFLFSFILNKYFLANNHHFLSLNKNYRVLTMGQALFQSLQLVVLIFPLQGYIHLFFPCITITSSWLCVLFIIKFEHLTMTYNDLSDLFATFSILISYFSLCAFCSSHRSFHSLSAKQKTQHFLAFDSFGYIFPFQFFSWLG